MHIDGNLILAVAATIFMVIMGEIIIPRLMSKKKDINKKGDSENELS